MTSSPSESEPKPETKAFVPIDQKALAIYLWHEAIKPAFVSWWNRRATWWFVPSEELNDIMQEYYAHDALVDPNEYFYALMQLNNWSKDPSNIQQREKRKK